MALLIALLEPVNAESSSAAGTRSRNERQNNPVRQLFRVAQGPEERSTRTPNTERLPMGLVTPVLDATIRALNRRLLALASMLA